jgi:hypothetical protein
MENIMRVVLARCNQEFLERCICHGSPYSAGKFNEHTTHFLKELFGRSPRNTMG